MIWLLLGLLSGLFLLSVLIYRRQLAHVSSNDFIQLIKMAERNTRRRKKKEKTELEKPTKEETAVARHLRFNLPTKSTSIDGHKVEYFTGSKAVDFLQDSKWATGKGKTDIIFTDRDSIANYLDGLLWKGLFYRTLKVVKKSKKDVKEKEESKKEKKVKKEKKKPEAETAEKGEDKEKEDSKGNGAKETKDGGKDETPPTKKKEGKKKIKLELTDDQKFVDGNDAFVWVYDPVRPMNYVYGLGLVIGAIAVCLFPLWPPWMRTGTYYLCLCGAGFVGAIFALAIIRLIIFVLTWGSTIGKIHFWLFPNLLADVGIKESFMPFYEVDYVTKNNDDDKTDKSKDDSNDEKGSEETEADDQPNVEKDEASQDSGPVENIPENIGDKEDTHSDQQGTPPENSDVTEEKSVESEDADEDDDDEEEDDDDDNGDDFEMIDEEEISEVCEASEGSQKEEEEEE